MLNIQVQGKESMVFIFDEHMLVLPTNNNTIRESSPYLHDCDVTNGVLKDPLNEFNTKFLTALHFHPTKASNVGARGIGGDLVGIAKGDPGNFWFVAGLDNEIYAYADYPGYWTKASIVNVTKKTGLQMIGLTSTIGANKFLSLVQQNCKK